MRRFNCGSQGRSESSFDYPATTRRFPPSNEQDSLALKSWRRYEHTPQCCSLKAFLVLVMGVLVISILWTRHGVEKSASRMKGPKQYFKFPVYANVFNDSWQDGAPFDNPSSVYGSFRRRTLLENSEFPDYISEVRPALKHMVYQIKVEIKGQAFYMALDTGSFASWLFCNYHPYSRGMKEPFYTPTPENHITSKKFETLLAESYSEISPTYLRFIECGPDKVHMCFEISYHQWGHLSAALVEDEVLLSARGPSSTTSPISLKFGCGFRFSERLVTASFGILGLGNMSISIPNQMLELGLIDHVISFCFSYGVYQADYDEFHANLDPVGYLVLGQPPDYSGNYQWIAMGKKPPGFPLEYGFDIVYFATMQLGKFKDNVRKHNPHFGATIIDVGSAYMYLISPLYHHVFDEVAACAHHHSYTPIHAYGKHTHHWKSPPLDSYFSIYKHFHELKMVFQTEDEQKYIFRISPFGYLHIVDKLDVPSEARILHEYVVALAVLEEHVAENEAPVNIIGGIALRGNKLLVDYANQRIGISPEYKCAMPD